MIAEVTNHLWQSTVFAIAIGLLTLAFRKNRAQVRYCLWLSASLKFLLPFSLLISLGSHLDWAPATQEIAAAPAVTLKIVQVSQPFPESFAVTPSARDARDWTAIVIFSVWARGLLAITLMRFRGWRRIQAAVRSSTPIDSLDALQVRSSPGLLEPGVVGLFRPILLLPVDIRERLKPRELQAVLAHELCHVSRRDNLTSAIHMIVEAVFWFYPLVWWIGTRLMEERERACDEAVLCLGNEPQDYAEGILNVCKSYLESPLWCVSGVTGSSLKKRIRAILTGHIARDLTFAKKFALTIGGIAAVALPIAVGIIGAPRIRAESRLSAPKFEAVSIKSCNAFQKGASPTWSPESMLHSQCTTVERLIQQAYGLFERGRWNPASFLTVTGGPAWTRSDLYEIDAKAASPQNWAMPNGPMLEALLEDRFKLTVHRETKEVPVYALTLAEGGPKPKPFQGSCTPRDFDKPPSDMDCGIVRGRGSRFHLRAATIADLSIGLSVLLDRHVVDQTRNADRFDIYLDLPAEDGELLNRPRSLPAVSDPTVPQPPPIPFNDIKTALKKLGMNIEPAKAPGEFIAIDHIERPSGN